MAFYNLWRNLVLLINNYVPPVAVAAVGWKFFILYIIIDAAGALFVYFFFVETHGRSLEELEAIFEAADPVKESLKKEKVLIVGAGD